MEEAALIERVSASDAMFDILVCKREDLPRGVHVLGPQEIERELLEAFPERLGAFPVHKAQRLLQRVAARVAGRVAREKNGQFEVTVSGLRHAWFFPVFSELTVLVPIRHLARQFAKRTDKRLIAVELPSRSFTALNAWGENQVEPLYVAHAFRQQGIPVVLFMTEEPNAPKLSFELSDKWLRKGYPSYLRASDFSSVFCKNAIRRPDVVAAKAGVGKTQKPGVLTRLASSKLRRKTCRFEIALEAGQPLDGKRTFTIPRESMSFSKAFIDLIGPLTEQTAQWYRTELASKPVKTAHVADHASFEGGLLAAEVVRQGGKVHIWPHSANVVHMDAHDPASVAQVTAAVQSTGEHWGKDFGTEKVKVWPEAILPETAPAPAFDETQPLHVVLFAGAHVLQRMPLLSYAGHKATWSKSLEALQQSNVKFVVKHKSVWETRKWIAERAANPSDLTFSNVHANKLKLPNMLFASISMTSTAILEGIARGIPGIVVRDIPIDETPFYDPEYVPCLKSHELGQFLSVLNSKTAWDALRDKQNDWFRQETESER